MKKSAQINTRQRVWEVNWGRSHIVAAAAGTDKAAPFVIYSHICCHTFVYIYPIRKNYNYLHRKTKFFTLSADIISDNDVIKLMKEAVKWI